VVFDLDETLIHCKDTTAPPYDVKLPITFPTGEVIEAAINIRPYAREILRNLSQHFELIIFTASHSCYANEVIDYLDADNEWIHHRLFREHCYLTQEGLYVKDLRILGRDLNQVVLVDNAAYSYAFQLENGIPIYPYYQGRTDFELRVLEEYLMKLLTRDMRATNDSTFKLTQYKHYYAKPNKLVEDLYIHK
jgi:CTD small phosphatase-like protein 2